MMLDMTLAVDVQFHAVAMPEIYPGITSKRFHRLDSHHSIDSC